MGSHRNATNSPSSDSPRGVQHAFALSFTLFFFHKDRTVNQTCSTIRQLRLSQLACLYARQTERDWGDEVGGKVRDRKIQTKCL